MESITKTVSENLIMYFTMYILWYAKNARAQYANTWMKIIFHLFSGLAEFAWEIQRPADQSQSHILDFELLEKKGKVMPNNVAAQQ